MTNLVKIKDVCVYSAMNEHALECYEIKKRLTQEGVSFKDLYYGDDTQHETIFKALSTWNWKDNVHVEFSRFPIVHWQNIYDDYTQDLEVVNSLEDFLNSPLMKNSDLAK